jgi:hypothetical protein
LEPHPDAPELGSLARVVCGPFGSAVTEKDYTESGVPLLRISDLTTEGEIDESDMRFISEPLADSLASTQMAPGDLVVSQRGTLGTPAVIPSTRPKWNISANLIGITDLEALPPEFVQFFLASGPGADQIERRQSGQVNAKITTGDVASVRVPVPPDAAAIVADLEAARALRQSKLAEADGLLAGLGGYLMDALELTLPDEAPTLTYAARLRDLSAEGRLDPDYFHPERTRTLAALAAHADRLRPQRLEAVTKFVRDRPRPSATVRDPRTLPRPSRRPLRHRRVGPGAAGPPREHLLRVPGGRRALLAAAAEPQQGLSGRVRRRLLTRVPRDPRARRVS